MTVGPGTPAHLVEAVSTPFCGRDLGHHLLSQHVPGRTHQLDRIELLTLHGIQQCGACTVLIGKRPVRSCGITVGEVLGKDITTIEGLSPDSSHPVQKAWVAEQVPQCGYCQSGQILAAVSLLQRKPDPTDKDIDRGMLNLCRCGTYARVRKAIHRAADMLKEAS